MGLTTIFMLSAASIATALAHQTDCQLSPRAVVTFNAVEAAAIASPLDKQLMSLSIEFGNTVDFFGDVGRPNLFSKQLLQNIVDRSGSPAILRIGGNTQDRTSFCSTCNETLTSVVLNNPDDPKGSEAQSVIINQNLFYVLEKNVPTGSPIIFGLNFRNNTYELAQAEVDAAVKYLNQSLIMAYELGNEVNLYGNFRPADYDVQDYAADMRSWLPRLAARSNNAAKFQFPSFAGPEIFKEGMSIAKLVEMGVPQSIPAIEYFSIHGYPWNICSPAEAAKVNLTNLLDHQKTLDLIGQYRAEITAAKSLGKMMHMGETGSVACHGKQGVSNTLGAALWELDYALSGTIAGINRFFFHMGKGDFYYSMWEPLPSKNSPVAHINPTYYAMLFIADLVADLQVPRIAPLTSFDTNSAIHFAVFDDDQLEKMVIMNTEYFDSASNRTQSSFDVSSMLGKNLRVRRLDGTSSDATTGVSWAGQMVDGDGRLQGSIDVQRVVDGIVYVHASEAVIVGRG